MKERIQRLVENGLETEVVSPMEPPQPYQLVGLHGLLPETLVKPLKVLFDDHIKFVAVIDGLESALGDYKSASWEMNDSISKRLKDFFRFMDEVTPLHNAMEEKAFFPVLHEKLIISGECSPGDHPTTAVDIMEDDHIKTLQSSALIFNLLGIANRLKDAQSRDMLLQIAYDQGRELVETLRLHIFKENEVLFPLAQKVISADEFTVIMSKMERYIHNHEGCGCNQS